MSRDQQASRSRSRISALLEYLGRLAATAQGRSRLMPGTLYEYRRRCGKLNCRCARGKLHIARVFSVYAGGRSRPVSMAGIERGELAQCVQAHQEFRKARAEMVRTHVQLMKVVDRLGKLRRISPDELRRQTNPK